MDSKKQWHGGKGSGRRSTADDSAYADNWDKIFGKKKPEIKVRKETPKHADTQIHTDNSKVIPRHYKYKHKVEE